ncbi:hypothetical protein [Streptomyces sp. NBC_01477]|uniref:hypothetical protein n=1 Tax=Streptomyces sp. NBC_01477 TaxID=2976015 RepID=UPI002E36057E|nr:hypothetical protein [Streptomyces sp. NBC_01477]
MSPAFRLPPRPPIEADLAERDRFQALVRDSLPNVRASAEAWRNGLAAFVTLVGTAVVVKGRTTAADLPVGWRLAVTVLIGGGLALAVAGLWHALAAQAGSRSLAVTLADIHREYGSLDAFHLATAIRAARLLTRARRAVALALACLFAGIALTWWAPGETAGHDSGRLRVTYGTGTVCGTFVSSGGDVLRLAVAGQSAPAAVPLAGVTSITPVAACG